MRIETAELREQAQRHAARLDWLAGLASFKAVVLEGLEVVFIVIAVGAGRGLVVPASLGALAAAALVLVAGLLIHRPLARVPENTLKFAVGVMLSAFGIFWVGEGLGVPWPGEDLGHPRYRTSSLAVSRERAGRRARGAPAGRGDGSMNAIANVLRELIGLIGDDGRLALWIVAVVTAAALVSYVPGAALAAGAILVLGCIAALIASVMTAAPPCSAPAQGGPRSPARPHITAARPPARRMSRCIECSARS